MSNSAHTIVRLLDPFLYDLCETSIRRSPVSAQYNGREIRSFVYDRPMDQHYIIHLMAVLLSVIKFGGASFTKVARSTQMSRCTHSGLQERVRDCMYTVVCMWLVGLRVFRWWKFPRDDVYGRAGERHAPVWFQDLLTRDELTMRAGTFKRNRSQH